MLPLSERAKKLTFKPEHLGQRLKERKHLFPWGATLLEKWNEISDAIKDPVKGVIIEDKKSDSNSTHICIFVGNSGKVIAVPIGVNASNIHVFTVKDVDAEVDNPNWYIREFNKIAEKRGLKPLNLVFKKTIRYIY